MCNALASEQQVNNNNNNKSAAHHKAMEASSSTSSPDMCPASASSLSTLSRPPTPTDRATAYTTVAPLSNLSSLSTATQTRHRGCYSLDAYVQNELDDPVTAQLCRHVFPRPPYTLRMKAWIVRPSSRLAALARQQIDLGGIGTAFETGPGCIVAAPDYPQAFSAREL